MRPALTKARLLRLLLTLLLVQATSSASKITSEAPPVRAIGSEAALPANKPLVNPPQTPKLSYAMMDVGGYGPSDLSWQQLLLEARTNISDIFRDGTRVKLKFQDDICKLSPTCDTVTVVKTVERNVIRYDVYIGCEIAAEHKLIDASEMRAVAKRVAWIISRHDKDHEFKNANRNR